MSGSLIWWSSKYLYSVSPDEIERGSKAPTHACGRGLWWAFHSVTEPGPSFRATHAASGNATLERVDFRREQGVKMQTWWACAKFLQHSSSAKRHLVSIGYSRARAVWLKTVAIRDTLLQ